MEWGTVLTVATGWILGVILAEFALWLVGRVLSAVGAGLRALRSRLTPPGPVLVDGWVLYPDGSMRPAPRGEELRRKAWDEIVRTREDRA